MLDREDQIKALIRQLADSDSEEAKAIVLLAEAVLELSAEVLDAAVDIESHRALGGHDN